MPSDTFTPAVRAAWSVRVPEATLDEVIALMEKEGYTDARLTLLTALKRKVFLGRRSPIYVDWSPLLVLDEMMVEIPDNASGHALSNAAHTWAYRQRMKVATRRHRDDARMSVYVLSRPA